MSRSGSAARASTDNNAGKTVRRLPDEIAAVLARDIQAGRLAPGVQLPTEQKLCAMFGVSRSVVREAISRLKSDGLVSSHQGRGAFVTEGARAAAFRISPACFAKRQELGQILELRTCVESDAAALAAQNRTALQLARMRKELKRMTDALKRGAEGAEQWLEAELAFCRAIATATGNAYFVEFLGFLNARIHPGLQSVAVKNVKAVESNAQVLAEHRAVYEAIERQDVEAARRAARRHFTEAARRLAARADIIDV
jgi:GntR family transcriptional repressor for pyruvate dehydrogenase complex